MVVELAPGAAGAAHAAVLPFDVNIYPDVPIGINVVAPGALCTGILPAAPFARLVAVFIPLIELIEVQVGIAPVPCVCNTCPSVPAAKYAVLPVLDW